MIISGWLFLQEGARVFANPLTLHENHREEMPHAKVAKDAKEDKKWQSTQISPVFLCDLCDLCVRHFFSVILMQSQAVGENARALLQE